MALPAEVMKALQLASGDHVSFDVDECGAVRLHRIHWSVRPPL